MQCYGASEHASEHVNFSLRVHVTWPLKHNATMLVKMCVKLGLASRLMLLSVSQEGGAEPIGHICIQLTLCVAVCRSV